MKLSFGLLSILCFFPYAAFSSAAEVEPLGRPVQTLRDLMDIDWNYLARASDERWVVGRFSKDKEKSKPIPGEPYLVGPDGRLVRGADGKWIPNPKSEFVVNVVGTCTLSFDTSAPSSPGIVHYSYRRPGIIINGKPYDIFRAGGNALFRYRPEEKGEAQFEPLFLFPEEWAKPWGEAWPFIKAMSKVPLSDGQGTPSDLYNKNPLLSLIAFQDLIKKTGTRHLTETDVARLLQHTDPVIVALYGEYFLDRGTAPQKKAASEQLGQWIERGESLNWIIFCLIAARGDGASAEEFSSLIDAIAKKATSQKDENVLKLVRKFREPF